MNRIYLNLRKNFKLTDLNDVQYTLNFIENKYFYLFVKIVFLPLSPCSISCHVNVLTTLSPSLPNNPLKMVSGGFPHNISRYFIQEQNGIMILST